MADWVLPEGTEMIEEETTRHIQNLIQQQYEIPCNCHGHFIPGVSHVVACCDRPHITWEEFEERTRP